MKWEAFPVTKIEIKCDHFNLNASIYEKLIKKRNAGKT